MKWETRSFEECIQAVKTPFKLPKKQYKAEGRFPVVSQEAALINGFHDDEKHVFIVDSPVVIFGDHTQVLKYIDFSFVMGADGVKIFKPIKEINTKFFYYSLQTLMPGGTGYARHYKLLKKLSLTFPSLEEQESIVAKLDAVFEEVAELERSFDHELKVVKSLHPSFVDTCLDSATHDVSPTNFGDAGTFVRGPFGGSLKKSIFTDSGYAVYEQQHAINDHCDEFRYFVSPEKFKEMSRFAVKPSDLIMSCSGTFGKITLVPEGAPEGVINQALLKISPHENVDGRYLRHWMRSGHFQSTLSASVGGTALQNVPAVSEMKDFQVKIPDLRVQQKAVQQIDEFEEAFGQLIETVEKRRALLNDYRRSISMRILSGGSQ